MLTTTIIILTYEITAKIKGALDVPNWLEKLYERTCDFWENLL